MKILHIGKYFHPSCGGIETVLMDLTRASRRAGVEQGVLVHQQGKENAGAIDAGQFPFLQYFCRAKTVGSLSYAPLSPGFPLELTRALQSFQPDLLDLHMPNPSVFWALLNRQARKIPWIVHWHSDASGPEFASSVRLLYPLYQPFEQWLLAHARRIIVTSPPYLEHSRALRKWRDKCEIVPLGLEPDRLACPPAVKNSPAWQYGDRLRILAVGRLTPYKGFDVLLRALAHTEAELVIAGAGAERKRLQRLARDLQISERVSFPGAVSDAVRNALLESCDLLCLPSQTRAEAFGISVLEGMAVGKPAVVSNIQGSGLPWLVNDGLTGWHVRPGDSDDLADRIKALDRDRGTIVAMGARARQRFEDHFHIDPVSLQTISVQRAAIDS